MPRFEFAYNLNGVNTNPPVAVQWPLSGTGAYNFGDLLNLDTTNGYMGTVAAGDPGTVAAVCACSRTSGTAGQPGTVYLVNPAQIWKCSTDGTSYTVNVGAGSVQVLNAGTVNSVAGTSDHCILYDKSTTDGNGKVVAYVRFPNCVFG